jgi:hypothetical protein
MSNIVFLSSQTGDLGIATPLVQASIEHTSSVYIMSTETEIMAYVLNLGFEKGMLINAELFNQTIKDGRIEVLGVL